MTNTRNEKRQAWQRHIQQWKISGLSQKAYCEENALTPNQFWYWQRQLRKTEPSSSKASSHTTQNGNAAFVPVHMAAPGPRDQGLWLELPNGIRLHGIAHSSPATLQHIIQAVS